MPPLTNENLVTKLKTLIGEERKITMQILEHLREVERRKIFLEMGYSSLFDFCVKELGYAEGSAYRRISAMRLLKEVPEVQGKIESGELSLSVVSQAQSFFKKQVKKNAVYSSKSAKLELLGQLENTSVRECEKVLLQIDPAPLCRDHERTLTPELTELRLTVDAEFMCKIKKLKNLLSNARPDVSTQEILSMALDQLLVKKDFAHRDIAHKDFAHRGPAHKDHVQKDLAHDALLLSAQEVSSKVEALIDSKVEALTDSIAATLLDSKVGALTGCKLKHEDAKLRARKKYSRHISQKVRRLVWQKSEGRCAFVDPHTGRRCEAQRFLHVDHVQPFSQGGAPTPDNLQLLCANHNIWKSNRF